MSNAVLLGNPQSGDAPLSIRERIDALCWHELHDSLSTRGYAETGRLLTPADCSELRSLYAHEELFRSKVVMERLRFGRGDYKYFAKPLPDIVRELRTYVYSHVAKVANEWAESLSDDARFPLDHAAFIRQCHQAGQTRPTPLLLHYEQDGYNCLHQDIYGAVAVYKAIKPLDKDGDKVFMVLGPWHHGQEIEPAASLGAIRFGSDTGTWFRQNVLRPFLDHYLKDDAPAGDQVAKVTVFETGLNRWQALPAWPTDPAPARSTSAPSPTTAACSVLGPTFH